MGTAMLLIMLLVSTADEPIKIPTSMTLNDLKLQSKGFW